MSIAAFDHIMAKSVVSSTVFLLLRLVVMDLPTMALGFGSVLSGYYKTAGVRIYNQIAVCAPTTVKCKSDTDHEVIAETTLTSGQRVEVHFHPSIWGTTRLFCEFNAWIDVFWGHWGRRFCTWCV